MRVLLFSDTNVTVLPLEVSLQRSYLERLCALATKFYRRTFCMVRSKSHPCGAPETLRLGFILAPSCQTCLLSELQVHLDPDHPEAARVPAIPAGFHRLCLADSELPNKQMPEVQGAKLPPSS